VPDQCLHVHDLQLRFASVKSQTAEQVVRSV
jgi:hypothetical protein